jgi:ABC-type Zn uptake system ZnuABC Zn-binding protein ZnuA
MFNERMKRAASAVLTVGLALVGTVAGAQIKVVTTDSTLAWIAARVGGERVKVESLARPTDDPHMVEPRPSMVLKLRDAAVFARIGMDVDMWADPLIEKAGNRNVMKGGKGYADCSVNLKVQELPPSRLDPSMGDIHAYGNPHYLLDPANGILAAGNIAAALIRVDPKNQPAYHQRFTEFGNEVKQRLEGWRKQLAPFKGAEIVTYHKTWVYFLSRFGLKEFATVEPKPGIAPSPGYVTGLSQQMKQAKVPLVLVENFRSRRYPDLLQAQTGAKAVYVPTAVGAGPGAGDYFGLFDTIVGQVAAGLN